MLSVMPSVESPHAWKFIFNVAPHAQKIPVPRIIFEKRPVVIRSLKCWKNSRLLARSWTSGLNGVCSMKKMRIVPSAKAPARIP